MKTSQTSIHEFLSQKSLAVVGVSRTGKKMGNAIYRALKQKGDKVFQIHPEAESIEGDRCYRAFRSLPEKVSGVVICVPPVQTEIVLKQALEAGITHVWMQQGSESFAAIRYCEKNGMNAVHGQCIMMFIEPVESFHKFHRWVLKLVGKYPSADTQAAPSAN
jgi:predicted CoA-binding protein